MITYIIVSYLIMLGVMIDNYRSINELDAKDYSLFLISPIVLPIMIGMKINS
jgi:hypothetical protein